MYSLLLIALFASPNADQATATMLDGTKLEGAVVGWVDQAIELQTSDGPTSLAARELLALNWPSRNETAAKDTPFVELIDGSRFGFTAIRITDRLATVTPGRGASKLEIPARLIHRVQLVAEAPGIDDLWREIEEKQTAGDVLVVRRRDGKSLRFLHGVLGDLDDTQLSFQWEEETIPVKRSKVAALAYYHATAPELETPICKLKTTGNRPVLASHVQLVEGLLRVTTLCGVELQLPASSVVAADFSLDKLAFLSDLEPLSVRWSPRIALPRSAELIGEYGKPQADRSFQGDALTLHWPGADPREEPELRQFSKGLAIRSRTEMVYRLPPGMSRFQAIAGIDPATATQGNVQLAFYCDDRLAWQGEINGKRPPVEISFELQQAKRLRVVVDFGKNLDLGDRLHLVDARVTK